jgi:hypothetical protein
MNEPTKEVMIPKALNLAEKGLSNFIQFIKES